MIEYVSNHSNKNTGYQRPGEMSLVALNCNALKYNKLK